MTTTSLSFEERLAQYADLAVRVGVGLQAGQRLIIRAPVEAAPLARAATEQAYKAGARLVTVLWYDDAVTLARYRHAPRDSFEEYAEFIAQGMIEAAERGDAVLTIDASDPDLLAGQDPELITLAQRTGARHMRRFSDLLRQNAFNWCIVANPIPSWAGKVFPDASPEQALSNLWDAVFQAVRADRPDAVGAWQAHVADLTRRRDHLNARRYHSLHFRGPGTDLTLGLAQDHLWVSASMTSRGGQTFIANVPTEEVFTAPHRERADGVISASKPLSYGGTLIEGIQVRFEGGRVVEATARTGEDVLRRLIETDEGSHRLGEVALVPHSSPIAQSGLLFLNTLFDENAASHLALGSALSFNVEGGTTMSREELAARGANDSLVHVDWMVGSAEVDVDGLREDGSREPVMRGGEWAFD